METKPKKKRTRGNPVPLIVEEYPADYDGYPFITLIQYHQAQFLTIVDNSNSKTIKAFVLDQCESAGVDESAIITLASEWYDNDVYKHPLSIAFARAGVTKYTHRIFKTFNIEYITRVIGPLPKYDMLGSQKIRKRKRKPLE